jgi:hypothetical protein
MLLVMVVVVPVLVVLKVLSWLQAHHPVMVMMPSLDLP